MDLDSKTLLDRLADRLPLRVALPPALHKIEHLIGTLVSSFGTAAAGNQSWQPLLLEGRFSQIECLPAHSEALGHLGYGSTLQAVAAQHLVLDLHSIARIQELLALKDFVSDSFRVRMQSSVSAQGFDLDLIERCCPFHSVNIIMCYTYGHVNLFQSQVSLLSRHYGELNIGTKGLKLPYLDKNTLT